MRRHRYTSTACTHHLHAHCRRVCKFCPAVCDCPCHLHPSQQSRPPEERR